MLVRARKLMDVMGNADLFSQPEQTSLPRRGRPLSSRRAAAPSRPALSALVISGQILKSARDDAKWSAGSSPKLTIRGVAAGRRCGGWRPFEQRASPRRSLCPSTV